jgi:replicative DNA helicase
VSEGLVGDVADLLARLGIVGRIRRVHHGISTWFTVDVSGGHDQAKFLARVGAFGPRLEPAESLERWLDERPPGTNVDTLPREVFDQVREAMEERGVTTRAMAALRGVAYGGSSAYAFAPSRSLMTEYATHLDDEGLRMWAESDVFWDRVSAVTPCDPEPVFDLTVPGPESWLAGVVCSHNSGAIEQDSDVVMFIHRDDGDPEKKRMAELIIAKHRNGPTGSVNLNFEPALTQFRNAARGVQA